MNWCGSAPDGLSAPANVSLRVSRPFLPTEARYGCSGSGAAWNSCKAPLPGWNSGAIPDPADAAAVTALLRRFVERTYRPVFEASLDRMLALAAPLNLARPELHMRWMTSRWGSCTMAKGKITINWALVGATPADIDAVVLHELVHFRHPDHSAAFYQTLYALMPDYPQRHARVRQLPAGFWKLT